ncbi:hypothetical protein QUF79_14475 [Fictibacillus enclensis]|uniref:hypothetical protein n=1 Tax=Fictibacillus enclensis TaxID=1017270 RepID=UPI0025A14C19|nr:hypothetical protein [Fictibacillus enclensis]MDM5199223.1 hypothetical protein [Fictibacillus enclensis]
MKKIKTVQWKEFFKIEEEEMVVFRIVPHATVLNNQSHKLWRSLHSLYTGYTQRISHEGFKFRYRIKERIWFDITLRSKDNGEKTIEFYLACPSRLSEYIKHQFQHEYKTKSSPGITLEQVTIPETAIRSNDTTVCDLKLSKHDIFSLDCDFTKQTSPISNILNCIHDVRGNDEAKISMCIEPYNRLKWNSTAEAVHDKFKKGKTQKRFRFSGRNSFLAVLSLLDGLFVWVNNILSDIIDIVDSMGSKEKRVIYHEKQREKRLYDDEKRKIILDGKLSSDTAKKAHAPVFKTHIRIASHSDNEVRRDMTLKSIATAFDQVSNNNELKPIELPPKEQKRSIKEMNSFKLTLYSKSDLDVNILSNYELGKLVQLPTADIQREYEYEINANKKVETEVPSVLATDKGLLIGHAEQKGETLPVSIPLTNLDESFKSYGFIGSPRMGKDTLMKNMIVEGCLKHNIGSVVIDQIMEDGERGLADGIRDALPPEKIVDIDLSDEDYFVPLDLSEIVKKLGDRRGSDRFANELIDFFDISDMGQSRAILRTFAKASKGSIYTLKLLLENEDIRLKRIKELELNGQLRLARDLNKWTTTYKDNMQIERDGQKALEGKSGAILYRLEEFLGTESTFNVFAQDPHPDIDFEQWMKDGKVIILRIPNRKLGILPSKTLAHWITLKVFMTKLLMNPNDSKTFIVFNEPHQYLTEGLKNLMQRILLEGSKWRLSAMFAFHHFKLLKFNLDEDLRAAGINMFLFANDNKKVYEDLLEQLKPTFDVELAMQTEAYHAICLTRFNGRRQNPFLMKALAPPSQRYPEYDNSFLTRRHSRQYGRHWKEIEKSVIAKEKAI